MFKHCALSLVLLLGIGSPAFSEKTAEEVKPEAKTAEESQKVTAEQVAKISEAFGHIIAKNIENIGMELNIAKIVQGLQDAASGKESPMTEAECVHAITNAQEVVFKEQAEGNLQKANDFLAKNAAVEGVVAIENGKVQYKIEKEGTGSPVEEHGSPMVRYVGKYLDGTVFGASTEEEQVVLDESIPGFGKALVGMKEGEKRTIYIHPDLAYGTSGYLPPNSLLNFEVEIVKAQVKEQQEATASVHPTKDAPTSEVASPTDIKSDIR